MISTQEVERAVARRLEAREDAAKREQGVVAHHSTVDPRLRELDRTIHGFWWEYHKRHLNRLELVSPTERSFMVARDHTLRDINDGYYALRRAVYELFGVTAPSEDEERRAASSKKGKAKENRQ